MDVLIRVTNVLPAKFPLAGLFQYFESGVKNQLISINLFREQEPAENKVLFTLDPCAGHILADYLNSQVLIYVSTNATHIHELPLTYTAASSPRIAMTRIISDLAMNTPVTEMQILSIVSKEDAIYIPPKDEKALILTSNRLAPRIHHHGRKYETWLYARYLASSIR